ncbi:MAG: hypothetical protein RLW62_15940 [Gammaproteobacteria bacterium]
MVATYTLAPGMRVSPARGHVRLVAPAQGFPQRPLAVPAAFMPRLATYRQARALRAAAARGDRGDELLAACLRHGVLRRYRESLGCTDVAALDAGFMIFALGSARYGRLAVNAARSIAHAAPGARIALVHDAAAVRGLAAEALRVFDCRIDCPPALLRPRGEFEPLWAKLHADHLSPYATTVVVDADSAFFPEAPLADELARYRDCDFAPACSFTHLPAGVHAGDRIIVWADADECIARFGVTRPLRQCHLFYFALRRSAAAARLFDTARRIYRELQRAPLPSMRRWHGGRVSAELAVSIATGLETFSLYSPSHMPVMNNHMTWADAYRRHYLGLVFCGQPPAPAWTARYDALVSAAAPPGSAPVRWAAAAAP